VRIVGKNRDYYDSALAHGADMSLVYERVTRKADGCDDDLGSDFGFKDAPIGQSFYDERLRRYQGNDRFMPCLLLFCGKAHPFFEHDYYRTGGNSGTDHLWDAGSVHASVGTVLTGRPLRRYREGTGFGIRHFDRKRVDAWFAGRLPDARIAEIHHRHRSPVVLYRAIGNEREVETVVDPILTRIGFQRTVDAFSAFQEIAMYLGGVLRGNENAMATISDEDKLGKHGMDEWSFRRKSASA
jgi:hypothetical protein